MVAALKVVLEDEEETPTVAGRKLGDFHVYQYGGSFMKTPVTLTEQVVAMDSAGVTVDFMLEESGKTTALRVKMGPSEEVLSVAKITKDGEEPATHADYDALVAKTQVAPESNDEMLSSEHTSCMVGDEAMDCDVTTFKVTLDGKPAKLTVMTSPKAPGRDLGGQIVAEDGKVIYSAKMVERGNEPPGVEAFAAMR